MRLSYLYNGNSYTGKMASLYQNGPPGSFTRLRVSNVDFFVVSTESSPLASKIRYKAQGAFQKHLRALESKSS